MKQNKLLASFGYAVNGIINVIRHERNMRIHVFIVCIVLVFGFLLKISPMEWIVCVICIGAVLCAECFNTALERLVDELSPEYNKRYGLIKDISAGGVLLMVIASVIVGMVIFIPKLILCVK